MTGPATGAPIPQEAGSAQAWLAAVFDRFAAAPGMAWLHEEGDLSYAGLHAAATALARRLIAQGRGPVLIHGHKDRRFIIGWWATLLAGRTVVPVETDVAPDRMARIAAVSGADLALLALPPGGAQPEELAGLPAWTVPVTGEVEKGAETSAPLPMLPFPAACDSAAYVLFSSGTTGQPKGIAVSRANLVDFAQWAATLPGPQAACISGNVRFCFDVSLFEMWFAWSHLLPISALDHRDLFNTGHQIARYRDQGLTTWVSTPALALHWVKDRRFCADHLPALNMMLFCGEVLSKSLVTALWERFPGLRILNTYGPTECTVAVTAVEITQAHLDDPRPLPIGQTRPGTVMDLRSPDATGLGEVVIRGASVGLGYLGDAARQAQQFPQAQTYLTGDWGRCDAQTGQWYFEGRKDREIKLSGYRIDLNTVEAALRDLPGVSDAVVDLHPGGRALRAFVLGMAGAAHLADLARTLSGRLPAYMMPRFWHGTETFSLNANSKLDRKQFVADLEGLAPYILPATPAPSTPPATIPATGNASQATAAR